jgi:ketosteroid isomerase-like protein
MHSRRSARATEPAQREAAAVTDLLEKLVARREIDDLVARYVDGVNRVDVDTWSATWADDAVWDLGRGVVDGKEAIVATWLAAMPRFTGLVQTASNGIVDVDLAAGTATGRWWVSEQGRLTESNEPMRMTASYDDRYVLTADGWRFAERKLTISARY